LFVQALHDYRTGQLDEAEAGFAALTALEDDLHPYTYQKAAKVIMARIALHRGDLHAVRAFCGPVDWNTPVPQMPYRVIMWARLLIADGSPEDAVRLVVRHRLLDDPQTGFRWSERPAGTPEWLVEVTEAAAASGHRDVAIQGALLVRRYSERNPDVPSFSALADQAEGIAVDDLGLLRRGLEQLTAHPRKLLEAGAMERVGQALLRHGDVTEAAQMLDTAWDAFQRLGAPGDGFRVQHTMQAAGFRRRRWSAASTRPPSGWEALTDRERRVARLVAEGHSNRSAADELSLSANTVAAHLRAIFRKLDVSSRVQLAHKLLEESQRTS
jgi:DNA-binding CsgD family transcriptional regulator